MCFIVEIKRKLNDIGAKANPETRDTKALLVDLRKQEAENQLALQQLKEELAVIKTSSEYLNCVHI